MTKVVYGVTIQKSNFCSRETKNALDWLDLKIHNLRTRSYYDKAYAVSKWAYDEYYEILGALKAFTMAGIISNNEYRRILCEVHTSQYIQEDGFYANRISN